MDSGEAARLQAEIDALKAAIAKIPVYPPVTPGTTILPGDSPGRAVLQRPLSQPYASFQAIWQREWFDVRLYGGSALRGAATTTTDAINQAIQDLNNNGGGVLYFPTGQYNVLGSILYPITKPCIILGDGQGLTRLDFQSGGLSGTPDGQNFGIEGLSMVTDGTSGLTDAITISDGTSGGTGIFRLVDLNISGWANPIIISAPGRGGFLQNCRMDYTGTGINLSASDAFIGNMWATNLGPDTAFGIHLNGDRLMLAGINLLSNPTAPANGIWLETGDRMQLTNFMIQGSAGSAIKLDAGTTNGAIHGGTVSDCAGTALIDFDPTEHFVTGVQGLGTNTDTTYDARRELSTTISWDPASIRILETVSQTFTLTGARPGDQVVIGTPSPITFGQVCGVVTANDTVTIYVTNMSTTAVDLAAGEWSMRIFH